MPDVKRSDTVTGANEVKPISAQFAVIVNTAIMPSGCQQIIHRAMALVSERPLVHDVFSQFVTISTSTAAAIPRKQSTYLLPQDIETEFVSTEQLIDRILPDQFQWWSIVSSSVQIVCAVIPRSLNIDERTFVYKTTVVVQLTTTITKHCCSAFTNERWH
ncbi:hypothetical protein AB0758_00015 [Tolypothrix bouteillei VB521301_2]|uniref:hypothetical protein n=1 Tax=Tolypothrix bouteillei TaxID=1246981 RepID=UPI0038B6625F